MTSVADYDEVFKDFEEEKVPSKHAGERFFLKFFLVTREDRKILAVTAEDQGDAHYFYRNAAGFNFYGTLESHSRKDVIMWLEKIIHESAVKGREVDSGAEPLRLETEDHPEGIYFVEENQKYSTFPDGRRCTEWYLVDNYGIGHRAVVGEENHARDGHYVYRSVHSAPLDETKGLECKNKAGVYHWLELWIDHGYPKDKRDPQRRSRPKRRSIVLDVGSSASEANKKSPILLNASSTNPEIVKAQECAREKEKLLLEAINFCFSKATVPEVECMQHWIKIIDEMKRQWEKGTIFSHTTQELFPDEKVENEATGFIYLKRSFYGLCLEAFREIGTMFVSMELMQKTGITKVVAPFRQYPTSDIAQYARHICERWTKEIEKHKRTMTSREMLEDPLDAIGHLLK